MFVSWFFGGKKQTTNRRDHTAEHACPFPPHRWPRTRASPSKVLLGAPHLPGLGATPWASAASGRDGGSRASLLLPVPLRVSCLACLSAAQSGDMKVCRICKPGVSLSQEAHASWTPGLCWAVGSMLPFPWSKDRQEYVDGGGGRPPQSGTLAGVTCGFPLLWLQDVH